MTNQKQGISALGLKRALGLGSYRTAWLMTHKLRSAMVSVDRVPLDGEVEVNEVFLGARVPGGGGRGGRKHLIVIAAERDGKKTGRVRLKRVPDTSQESLCSFVEQNVVKPSVIITDGWQAYQDLKKRGYVHRAQKSPFRRANPTAKDPIAHAHQVASLLKRWLNGVHHGAVSGRYLDQYLEEFTFRFNRRTSLSRGLLFYRLLSNAVRASPLSQTKLLKNHKILGLGE